MTRQQDPAPSDTPEAHPAARADAPGDAAPAAAPDLTYHMRRLADQAPSMMAYWGRDLRCRFANLAYAHWAGVEPDGLVGRSISELLGPSLFALNEPHMRAALRGEPQRFERLATGHDGVQRHHLAMYLPDELNGEVVGFMSQVTDVTPLKQTQAQLQAAIDRLEAEATLRRTAEDDLIDVTQSLAITLDSIGAGFVGVDQAGRITRFNAVAQRVFEWDEVDAVGRTLGEVVQREGRSLESASTNAVEHLLAEAFPADEGREIMAVSRQGRRTPLELHVGPTRSPDGEVRGVALVFRDLTLLRQAETERAQHLADLRRSNAELEQFAYVASHDLQEPLRMVANYTELLAKRYQGQLDERADKYIHFASDGARRMQRLVADLLAYSRVGTQGQPLVATSSQQALRGVLDVLRQVVRESQARIEFDGLPMVMADPSQLHQLLQNLISNAIKFRGASPPCIVVKAEPAGAQWAFSVADNGIGLEMRFAERIFQMFQRLHELGRYEGSGMGLALCKRIVERHGGRIWVESTPGLGTSFHFTLPGVVKAPA
jgi:PAS domain S-box-containing protein